MAQKFRRRTGKDGKTVYQARVYVKGQAYAKTFKTESAARKWRSEKEAALLVGGGDLRPARGVTVRTALEEYRDRQPERKITYRFTWLFNRIDAWIGDRKLDQITVSMVEDYYRERAKHVTPQSVAVELSWFRSFWKSTAAYYEVNSELVVKARDRLKESELVSDSEKRVRLPSEGEIDALRDYFNGSNRIRMPMADMMDFSIFTCMRRGELLRIRREDWVDGERPSILIRDRKDPRKKVGNHQRIPLLGEANEILRRQPDRGPEFFPYLGKSVTTCFRNACKTLGIDGLVWHDLRHEGITRLVHYGWTLPQIAKVSGHSKYEHLKRYVNESEEHSLHDLPYG